MGRKKKLWKYHGLGEKPKGREDSVYVSSEEQEFLDLVEMADLLLPFCFKNWRHYFLDEERFLKEGERWFMARVENRPINIETDRDKGLMTGYRRSDPWDEDDNQFINRHMRDDTIGTKTESDYWSMWRKGSQQHGSSRSFWRQTLPMDSKIPAPSGKSGMTHVCL